MTDESDPPQPPAGESSAAPPPGGAAAPKRPHRKLAVVGLMVGMLLGALDNTIVATAGNELARDLGSASGFPFVVAAYLVAQTIAMPIMKPASPTRLTMNALLAAMAALWRS